MPSADLFVAPRRGRRRLFLLVACVASAVALYLAPPGFFDAFVSIVRPQQMPSPELLPPAREKEAPRPLLRTDKLSVFLAELAVEAGLGLAVSPLVDMEVSALVAHDNPWRERLDAYAETYGFDYDLEAGLIQVLPERSRLGSPDGMPEQPRPPALEARGGREPAVSPLPAKEKEAEPQNVFAVVPLGEAQAEELAEVLEASARPLGVGVVAEPVSNSLVLVGRHDAVAAARRLASDLDVARRVFMLEAEIVEVSETARKELGVEWALSGEVGASVSFPSPDASGETSTLTADLSGNPAFAARLSALEASGMARVISRPRLLIREGREATIESVRILRVRLPDRSALLADEDVAAAPAASGRAVESIPVGLSLRVEPLWQGSGRILMKIRAKSSALGPPLPPDGIPEEFSRVVEAEVVVSDGHTAVLGGLLRDGLSSSGSGVPGFRGLPLLGPLFGSNRDDSESEELIFMVTPKLLG